MHFFFNFRYLNDVVIQHHDTIVTSSDLGLAVTCQYDLTNKTVANEVDLGIHGDIQTGLSEEVIVDSPNVAMRITDRSGDDVIASAEVGDPLVRYTFQFFFSTLSGCLDIIDSSATNYPKQTCLLNILNFFELTSFLGFLQIQKCVSLFLGSAFRDHGPELTIRDLCTRACRYGRSGLKRNHPY